MPDIKKDSLKIINWCKKHKIAVIILFILFMNFCADNTRNFYASNIYGDFRLIAKYPVKDIFNVTTYDTQKAIIIDNENVLFVHNDGKLYNLNWKKRSFKKYSSELNGNCTTQAANQNGEIYIKCAEADKETVFIFDYKNDNLEKTNKTYPNNEIDIDTKTNTNNHSKYIGSLDNKNPVFIREELKESKYYVDITDLKTKKTISKMLNFNTYEPIFIWLNNDSFLAIANDYDSVTIKSYKIENNKITDLNSKTIKKPGLIFKRHLFIPSMYVVLNNNTVLFANHMSGDLIFPKDAKRVYLYDNENNKITRIADFPHKISRAKFIKIADDTILVYDTFRHVSFILFGGSAKDSGIYIFKLKKGMHGNEN